MTEQITGILETLKARTLRKEVIWTNTRRATEYQLQLPSGRITVDHWTHEGAMYADVRVYNKDGIEVLVEAGQSGSEEFDAIVSLHNAIVDRKLKIEETLAGLAKEVRAQGTLGDEIPF